MSKDRPTQWRKTKVWLCGNLRLITRKIVTIYRLCCRFGNARLSNGGRTFSADDIVDERALEWWIYSTVRSLFLFCRLTLLEMPQLVSSLYVENTLLLMYSIDSTYWNFCWGSSIEKCLPMSKYFTDLTLAIDSMIFFVSYVYLEILPYGWCLPIFPDQRKFFQEKALYLSK